MLTGLVPLEICERKVVPGSSPGFREFLLSLVFCGLSKPPPLAAFVFMWCSPCMRLPPNSPVLEECQSYWVNTYRYDLIITQLITSASQVVLLVKNPPAMQQTWVQSLGWEDPLEKGKATYSSNLALRIPWTV